MSKPVPADAVKLMVSMLAAADNAVNEALRSLSERYGTPDYISHQQFFNYSDYYERQMGSPLVRRFVFFETLIRPEELPDIKIFCNSMEERFSREGKRRVNLDPGYLALPHLILATGKGYSHRPYLRDGIYADLTLIYRDGSFHPLPWTYPDYASLPIRQIFNVLRQRYSQQLRKASGLFTKSSIMATS